MIRVGRCKFNWKTKITSFPEYDGYTSIVVLTKNFSSKGPYYQIGPYDLKDKKDRIMENIWQFSKVYQKISAVKRKQAKKIIWDHPSETHVENGKLTKKYYDWRKKGMNSKFAIRYPLQYKQMKTCLYALEEPDSTEKLGYIQSRKKIYLPVYCDLVKKHKLFKDLKKKLKNGEKLLIIEVDGPHQEDLDYYIEKYKVKKDFIKNDTMLVNKKNINIMLNDKIHPFGHGYCLAMALLGKSKTWNV